MRTLTSLFMFVFATAVADEGPFVFEFEQLAPDVWAGVRSDSSRFPVMGNTTFVIGDEGVVVFDGGGMPAMAEQIIEKVHRYHEQLGHEVLNVNADGAGLTPAQHRGTLELFQSEIAPALRREIPSRPFPPAAS